MNINKKKLFTSSLLALVLALNTACDETPESPEETASTTTTTTYSAEQVNKAAATPFAAVNRMAKSLNGSTLYVAEAGALHAIGAAGTVVKLGTKPNLGGGAAVGKADLSGTTGEVTHLSPTATGVLATLDKKHVALYNGAAVDPINAWKTDGKSATTDVVALADNASKVKAFMANSNIYLNDLHHKNNSRFLTIATPAPGAALSQIANVVQADAGGFNHAAPPFMASVGNKAFVVDRIGVFQFDADGAANVSVAQPVAPAQAADWLIKGAQAVGTTAKVIDAANKIPSCVLINNNKLYIGFTSTPLTGGVAIYNLDNTNAIAAGSFVPTSFADRSKDVVALTAHGNDVYAVLDTSILKVVEGTGTNDVNTSGPEVQLVGDLSAYYTAKKADGTSFAFGVAPGQIGIAVAAEFMGDDLYVATTEGLYKFTKTTVTK